MTYQYVHFDPFYRQMHPSTRYSVIAGFVRMMVELGLKSGQDFLVTHITSNNPRFHQAKIGGRWVKTIY